MLTSYKFWYISRDDDGFITECAIRYFEGDKIAEDETNPLTKEVVSLTRYRRRRKLGKGDLSHLLSSETMLCDDHEAVIYNPEHLGSIKTDDELRVFLNGELKNDIKRTPIDVQSETDLEKMKLLINK